MKRIHRHDIRLVLVALSVAVASATCSNSMTGPGTGSCGTVSTGGLFIGPLNEWFTGAGFLGTGGTVKIDTFTASGASGSFDNFTLVAVAGTGATGTKTVTNGRFSVTF